MSVLGLILILLAVVIGAVAVYGLPTAATQIGWDFFGNHFQISATTVFFIGAASMLALLLGIWLLLAGLRRSARRSRELRTLKKEQRQQAKDAERARLDAERTHPTTHPATHAGTHTGTAGTHTGTRPADTLTEHPTGAHDLDGRGDTLR